MIPKIIHSIWFQGWDSLPEKYYENIASVGRHNPDWQYIKWDSESIRNLIRGLGDDYLQKYDDFKVMHQKIDFGRYAIIYAHGGVSVDTDVFALKGFDETP